MTKTSLFFTSVCCRADKILFDENAGIKLKHISWKTNFIIVNGVCGSEFEKHIYIGTKINESGYQS